MRLQLRTDDRKVSEGTVDEILPQLLVVTQGVAEDGREQEQQRKECKKAVVSDERRFATCLIVAELLRHGERESERRMVLLESIDSPYDDFDLAGGFGHVFIIASLSRPPPTPNCRCRRTQPNRS